MERLNFEVSNYRELFSIVYPMMNSFLNPMIKKMHPDLENIFGKLEYGVYDSETKVNTRLYSVDSHTGDWCWNYHRIYQDISYRDLEFIFYFIIDDLKSCGK